MKKVLFSGFVAMTFAMFSISYAANTGEGSKTTAQINSEETIGIAGNNNCTPSVENYDESFTITGIPPFPVNLICIDEVLNLSEINIHFWGKAVVAASCHVNDKGQQEENTYFVGTESGDVYLLTYSSQYHYNYNYTFEGGIINQQGADVGMSNMSGEITNMTTGEVIPVSVSNRYTINASGMLTMQQYELNCD